MKRLTNLSILSVIVLISTIDLHASRIRYCNAKVAVDANVRPYPRTEGFDLSMGNFVNGVQSVGRHGGVQPNTARARARDRVEDCFNRWVNTDGKKPSEIANCNNANVSGGGRLDSDFESRSRNRDFFDLAVQKICNNGFYQRFSSNAEVSLNAKLIVSGNNSCGATIQPSGYELRTTNYYNFCLQHARGSFGRDQDNDGIPDGFDNDKDNDGLADRYDTCPNNKLVDTHINVLPTSQAQCSMGNINNHLNAFTKGRDNRINTNDECDQYQLSSHQKKSLKTFYHVITNTVGDQLCNNLGAWCTTIAGVRKSGLFKKKRSSPSPRDTISFEDLIADLDSNGSQPDLNSNTGFFTKLVQKTEDHTQHYLENMTSVMNDYLVDPYDRRVSNLFHEAFGVDEKHFYCSMKSASNEINEFAIGVVIGVEDIPLFYASLVDHPVQTMGDMVRLGYTFVLDPGEAVRGFVNIDVDNDDGATAAFKIGRVFGNFVPDLIGAESLPGKGKSTLAGVTETPKVLKYARFNFRDVMNAQLSSIIDELERGRVGSARTEARLFVNKLKSMAVSADLVFQLRGKLYGFLREVQIALGKGNDLRLNIDGRTITFTRAMLPEIEVMLRESLFNLIEEEARLSEESQALRDNYQDLVDDHSSLPELDEAISCSL